MKKIMRVEWVSEWVSDLECLQKLMEGLRHPWIKNLEGQIDN